MSAFFTAVMAAVVFALRGGGGSGSRRAGLPGGLAETLVVGAAWLVLGLFALTIGGTFLMCAGRDFCTQGSDADAWMLPFMLAFIAAPAVLVILISAIGRRLG